MFFRGIKYVRAVMVIWAAIMGTAAGHEYQQGDLVIAHPWSRATAPNAPNGVAYLAITNHGAEEDQLISVEAQVSDRTELHMHEMTDGVMRMRPVEGSIALPAGETIVLEPSGLHIMLMGLDNRLVEGERFTLVLEFQNAGTVEVEASIESPGAVLDLHHNH
ncbi:MAG: copper chaperone PCu(A)C [Pseudomonadota bacterium]